MVTGEGKTGLTTFAMAQNLLPFHSITGCDTTSFFYGISKKKAYKVYEQDVNLLEGIGEAELTDEKIKLAEVFIGKFVSKTECIGIFSGLLDVPAIIHILISIP
jgi:hypothetical protein